MGPYLSHAEIAGVKSRLARYGHAGNDVFVEYFEQFVAQQVRPTPGGLWHGRRGLRDDRRARIAILLALVGFSDTFTAREARAADPRLVRVVLLRVADRMSLALEMSGEPQKAALRVFSARALEIEAGPVSGLFREEQLAPASDVAFIRQVSIQRYTTGIASRSCGLA